MIRQGRTAGTYRARSGLDNVERTFSYRKASGYPLSIVVGLATGDYLSEWRSGVAQTSAFVALFCLITSFSAWLIYREWKRKNSAMADLLRQKAKYHTVADHTHAWEFWLSPDDSFVYTSPSCKRITGYDAEAFYADPGLLDRIVLPDDQGRYADHRHDVRSSTATHQLVIRIRHADGSIRWLEHVCQPIIDDGGVFHGTRGSNRDITERKRMEEALRESEDHFHQLFIQNWDAVTLLKQGTHDVLDANPAMIALFGYSLEELRDCGPWPIMAPDAAPEFLDFLRHAAAQGDASLEKIVCNGKDGIPRIISTKAKLIRLREEDVIYCSFRDISERIRLESANREAQAKLIHANKMSSLGMLVSGIAHEINNPNQYISLNASILAEIWGDATAILARYREECGEFTVKGLSFGQARETVPRLLTALTEGSRRISLIVNNLKDFCRDDSGRQQAAFDLNKTVHAAVQILTHHIHKHTDDFRLELAEDVPPVRGKVQQIEQVIINLITNALQALPEKGRGVRVGTRYERHGDTVVLTVRDEGRGMTQKLMERITEPFFSTRIEEGGTGLGLSISAAIIKEHDGTLEFESTPDLGTTATIRLHAAPSGSSAGSAGEGAGSR